MTHRETTVPMWRWIRGSSIFTPMKVSRMDKPIFRNQNLSSTLSSIKNRERSPIMAKMLEKKTM